MQSIDSINNAESRSVNLSQQKSFNSTRRGKMLSNRLLIMLITINISFCVFSMPMTILNIVYNAYIKKTTSENKLTQTYEHDYDINNESNSLIEQVYSINNLNDMNDFVDFLHAVAELLQFINHGSNFILYCLSGKTFRKETKLFFSIKYIYFKDLFLIFNRRK